MPKHCAADVIGQRVIKCRFIVSAVSLVINANGQALNKLLATGIRKTAVEMNRVVFI